MASASLRMARLRSCSQMWQEGAAEVEAQINGLLTRVTALRQMLEGTQRLLKADHGLLIGGLFHGVGASLPEVHEGFVPHLTMPGVLRQQFGLGLHRLGKVRLQGLGNTVVVLAVGCAGATTDRRYPRIRACLNVYVACGATPR